MNIVDRMFHNSNSPRYFTSQNFVILLNEKAIKVDVIFPEGEMFNRVVSAMPELHDFTEVQKLIPRCIVHGGNFHLELAYMAAAYLIDLGHTPKYEQVHHGKRVDVITSDFSHLIECGDNEPDAVLNHLIDPVVQAFYTMPFYFPHEKQEPTLFKITRAENWDTVSTRLKAIEYKNASDIAARLSELIDKGLAERRNAG